MNAAQIFSLVSTLAALQWFILVFLPRLGVTVWLTRNAPIPILFSVLYAIYIVDFFSVPGAGFGSIAEVRVLFSNDNLLLAGWIHYLAFDLLIGFYILKSAQASEVPHLLVVPCLILTFLFGPCGYLVYQLISKIKFNENVVYKN